jgi:hypothetical protein
VRGLRRAAKRENRAFTGAAAGDPMGPAGSDDAGDRHQLLLDQGLM